MAVLSRVKNAARRSRAVGELLGTIGWMSLSPHEEDASRVEHAYRIHRSLKRLARAEDVAEVLEEAEANAVLRRMIERGFEPERYTLSDLSDFSRETLGGAFRHHMESQGLGLEIFPDLPRETALDLLERRGEQTHDYLHVVTGYDTTVAGEVALAGFYVGNYTRHLAPAAGSLSVLPMILAACSMLRYALHRRQELLPMVHGFVDGWQRGYDADALVDVDWETMWGRPLAELREELSIRPRHDPVAARGPAAPNPGDAPRARA